MNHLKLKYGMGKKVAALAFGLALTACTAEHDALCSDAEGGRLLLTLSDASASTRTLPSDLLLTDADGHLTDEVASAFLVHLAMADSAYSRDVKASDRSIRLPLGRYTAQATHGSDALLAWDNPYCTGTAEFRLVQANEQVSVDIPCTMHNALADFQSDDFALLDAMLARYAVRIIATDGLHTDSIDWTPSLAEHPYVKAGARIACYLVGTRADGRSVRLALNESGEITTQASHCYRYHLRIQASSGTADSLQLSVEREDTPITLIESIPSSWLPAPKITASSSDDSEFRFTASLTETDTDEMDYVETLQGDATLDVTTSLAASAFTLQTTSLGNLPDDTYDLLHLTPEQEAQWTEAGLSLTTSEGGLHHRLNLSRLINQLESLADGTTHDSELQLSVTANSRTATHTYVIHTEAPEYTLTLDERHIWTKTLTLGTLQVTRGNAEELRRRLSFRYQVSDDASATTTEDGALEVEWEDSQAGKTCHVTAVYRDKDILQTTLSFESPTQIPNSDFEEWTDDNYYGSRYSFNPWGSQKSTLHWDTNNSFTTRHRNNYNGFLGNTQANYNGMHAVSHHPHNGGWCAELRNTANGRGNTTTIFQNYNKKAGELYTGDGSTTCKNLSMTGDADGSKDVYTQTPAAFTSRPTAVRFQYEYIPKDDDTAEALLELKDAQGEVILSQSIQIGTSDGWQQGEIALPVEATQLYGKCATLLVRFKSTIHEGSSMNNYYSDTTYTYYYNVNDSTATKNYERALTGSILRIDDVELIYDR